MLSTFHHIKIKTSQIEISTLLFNWSEFTTTQGAPIEMQEFSITIVNLVLGAVGYQIRCPNPLTSPSRAQPRFNRIGNSILEFSILERSYSQPSNLQDRYNGFNAVQHSTDPNRNLNSRILNEKSQLIGNLNLRILNEKSQLSNFK